MKQQTLLIKLLGRLEYNKIIGKRTLDAMADKYMVKRQALRKEGGGKV